VVSGEALRRLTEMSTHYCLHEHYPRAAEGIELVKALNRLMYEAASEVGLHVEELSLGLVRWLEGVAGCPPAVDPVDGLNRLQLRWVAERVDAGLDKPLSPLSWPISREEARFTSARCLRGRRAFRRGSS